ncbi:solute carrier organic anion transporter family member 2A1-like isoform X1 [Pomacea canaliculata]|uniref:solute carrier organic anion transporter family member 2A1-like isoform X1 n=1 Tax=Pomacea canaliculata TaxID=400727 RepID=UPI000D729938|nr:solute carrier organic anion transporter family member 2A1-like isoform X1 [Pomacea canaliculata]XP_025112530.1 solute carrier organic anion transporter family member 2A1-like isoform X1 [Pomacea canaliculata]XP_025112531.1 solute carrier organic anion transporter family member 2A1-like isoform X1 [Pomacea canaliculata]
MASSVKNELEVFQADNFDNKRTDGNHDNNHEIVCGVGPCRPSFMQRCARVGCFTAMYSVVALFTSTLNVYIQTQISTLERQFGLSSSISGILMSSNELGYLLTTLPLSHLARRVHIPRAFAICTLLFGLSGLLCTVPFFVSRDSFSANMRAQMQLNTSWSNVSVSYSVPLCTHHNSQAVSTKTSMSNGRDTCGVESQKKRRAISEDWKVLAVAFLALGMILQGFGKSPRQAFATLYIDDNVPKTETPLHFGIIACLAVFGPVIAYVVGGVSTTIYITLEDTVLSPFDPRWVGAWWLGFLVFGIVSIVISVPLVFFPKRLRPQPQLEALKKLKSGSKGRQCIQEIQEFLRTAVRLVMTPVYVLVVLGNCCLVLGLSGLFSFLPKYIETQFSVPALTANFFVGLVNAIPSALGVIVGGLVTSRFKIPPMKCLKIAMVLSSLCCITSLTGFLLGCDQPSIHMGTSSPSVTNTSQRCQSSCQCDDSRYFPTCGADGVTYFSPCHAGCSENTGVTFRNCSCILKPSNTSQLVPEAVSGLCGQNCNTLHPYIALSFFSNLFASLHIIPIFIVLIRSVTEADKPLSVGLTAFLYTVLGFFPGPVLFGRVVDTTCLLWSSGCAGSGSCIMYDHRNFRHRLYATFFITMVLNLTFFVIAFIVASRMKKPFYAHCEDEAAAETMRRDEDKRQTENMAPEKVDRQDDTPSDSGRIFFTKYDDNSVVVCT